MSSVSAAESVVVMLLLVISLGGGLMLYWAVQQERDWGEPLSREEAERAARRDVDDGREERR